MLAASRAGWSPRWTGRRHTLGTFLIEEGAAVSGSTEPPRATGGRVRLERLARLITYGRFDPMPMATHVFHGLDHIEEALLSRRRDQAGRHLRVILCTGWHLERSCSRVTVITVVTGPRIAGSSSAVLWEYRCFRCTSVQRDHAGPVQAQGPGSPGDPGPPRNGER